MDGSVWGNIMGVTYWAVFMGAGIWMGLRLFSAESRGLQILVGSVMGSFLLQWLPLLCSIPVGFTKSAHGVAVILLVFLVFAATWFTAGKQSKQIPVKSVSRKKAARARRAVRKSSKIERADLLFLVLSAILFLFFCYLLKTHTIPQTETGSYETGQATYGDMNMHFSFITSIATQGFFPPEYSILPGYRICYPFLCDSISSSIYIWGAGLRIAYNLPMMAAFWQVMGGVYLLAGTLFRKWNGILTWILFFFDGGLGVLYFLNIFGAEGTSNFTRIFTEFYQTPTNYLEGNIRWVNVVVDMLLPQRATLFGWAVLFPTILLLATALRQKKRSYMLIAGIITGGMPMIHTHSFVAMAFIGAIWLLGTILQETMPKWMEQKPVLERGILLFGFILLNLLSTIKRSLSDTAQLNENLLLGLAFANAALITLCCIWAVWKGWTQTAVSAGSGGVSKTKTRSGSGKGSKLNASAGSRGVSKTKAKFGTWAACSGGRQLVILWGIFLGLVLVLALPQLLTWTFQQAQGEQFLRGGLNWCNDQEHFLVFYIKNLGLMFVLGIVAVCCASRKQLWRIGPAFFIWFTAELVLFQPNTYDNNKLLFVAYLFLCMQAAEWILNAWEKLSQKPVVRSALLAVCLVVTMISAVLTMGREAVSRYELYAADEVKMCHYIEEVLEPDAVILTDTRHNNGISSLTGRNIVCGSSSILYYHGLPYQDAEEAVAQMYADPANTDLLDQYGVDYILVGPSERYNYGLTDDSAFLSNYAFVHSEGEYNLYRYQ